MGQVLAVESLARSSDLVLAGCEQVGQCNHCTFKLGTTTSVDRRRTERFPDDRLADVCRNEERDTRAQAVTLLEELVREEDDQTRDEQLDDNEQADSFAYLARVTVHASHYVDDGLADSDHHAKH